MSDWIPIDAEPQPLTPTQQRIKELLDAGKKVYEIVWAVHMGKDFVIDEIYQIRKKESILNMGKLTDEQRKEIIERWKAGESQAELAKAYGVSAPTVCDMLKRYQKKTQINPEFDAAVNEMIAESKAADAEEKTANAETEKSSADIPDYVLYAVDCRIADLEHRLQDFADQKAMLEHDLRRLQENIESVQDEHDKLADWKLEVDP